MDVNGNNGNGDNDESRRGLFFQGTQKRGKFEDDDELFESKRQQRQQQAQFKNVISHLADQIASHMNDPQDIINFCEAQTSFNEKVCHNPDFWHYLNYKYFKLQPTGINESWVDSRFKFIKNVQNALAQYKLSNLSTYGITVAAYMAAMSKVKDSTAFATNMTLPSLPLNTIQKMYYSKTNYRDVYYMYQGNYGAVPHYADITKGPIQIKITQDIRNTDRAPTDFLHIYLEYEIRFPGVNVRMKPNVFDVMDKWAKQYFNINFYDFNRLLKGTKDKLNNASRKLHKPIGRLLFLLNVWYAMDKGPVPLNLLEAMLQMAILDKLDEQHLTRLGMDFYDIQPEPPQPEDDQVLDEDGDQDGGGALRPLKTSNGLKLLKPLKNKGKLALCFLVTGDLHNLELWERWWKGYEHLVGIYVHYSKNKSADVTQDILIKNRVRPVPTRWGDISLVYAEKQLYRKAYKNPSNKFFILLSGTCAPVRTFEHTYRRLFSNTYKGIIAWRDIGKIDYYNPSPFKIGGRCDKWLRKYGLYKDPYYAGDQWKALSRHNVRDFFEMFRHSDYVNLFTRCIDIVPDSLAPDEFMYINFLAWKYHGKLNRHVRNRLVTFVDFEGKAVHPVTYRQITRYLKDGLCETNALFVRKILNPLTNRILKQTPIDCNV